MHGDPAPGNVLISADGRALISDLGLSFLVKDVAILDGTSDTVRIRAHHSHATYETGQPDGRTVPQAQDIVGRRFCP